MVNSESENEKTGWSFEMFLRKTFKGILDAIAGFFLKLGFTPNMITLSGLLLSAGVAVLIGFGHITWAGILMVVAAPMDALDGAMARLKDNVTTFGAFLDSVVDRFSELIVLGGLLFYYMQAQNSLACLLVFIAAGGSVMVSYTKARAESLGYNAKVGIMTRVERMIVLAICLLFNIPIVAMWILAVLTLFTAVQRIIFVKKQADAQ